MHAKTAPTVSSSSANGFTASYARQRRVTRLFPSFRRRHKPVPCLPYSIFDSGPQASACNSVLALFAVVNNTTVNVNRLYVDISPAVGHSGAQKYMALGGILWQLSSLYNSYRSKFPDSHKNGVKCKWHLCLPGNMTSFFARSTRCNRATLFICAHHVTRVGDQSRSRNSYLIIWTVLSEVNVI